MSRRAPGERRPRRSGPGAPPHAVATPTAGGPRTPEAPGPHWGGRAPERADRPALVALVLLAALLHGPAVVTGFADEDLLTLETVIVTNFEALLRGGVFPGAFSPVSRELHLWWWGKMVGLGATAFHVFGAVLATAAAVCLYRALERWAGARAALIAVAGFVVYPPLGTMLASVTASRDLLAALAVVVTLACFARGLWLAAGLTAGLAVLSRETALLLPLGLTLADAIREPGASLRERLPRVGPALAAGVLSVLWIQIAPGAPHAIAWTPAAPLDLAASWAPPGIAEGLATLWRGQPWRVVLVAVLAAVAIPWGGRRPGADAPPALRFASSLVLLALLPALAMPVPRRLEAFAIPALGLVMAGGVAAAVAGSAWVPRLAAALLALVSLGAHALPTARDKFLPVGAVRVQAAATAPLLAALQPWSAALAASPRTFATGLPPDSAVRLALGPGARVVTRNGGVSIRFVAEMRPDEAAAPFAVLRQDATGGLRHEPADARVRARIGEGLLVFARHAPAAALFAAARAERPDDPELAYPHVATLAASGDTTAARAAWAEARARGLAPVADTVASRLLAGVRGPVSDSQAIAVRAAMRRVWADPAAAAPHLELGRALLQAGSARSATLEFSVGTGISRRSEDVFWMAQGYEAMGADREAIEAYAATLAGGLDSTRYAVARTRMVALMRATGIAPPVPPSVPVPPRDAGGPNRRP